MGKRHSQNAGFHLVMVFSYTLPCPRPFILFWECLHLRALFASLFKYDILFFDVIFLA
jgi:hypothetical protein